MFSIEIIEKNKSKKLTQWDTDRCIKITAPEGVEVSHADFAHEHDSKAIRREVVLSDGTMMAKIPNSLLQRCGKMRVWLVCDDVTVFGDILVVAQKARDEGYILPDDEDDVYNYTNLEKRIEELEKGGGGISEEVFEEEMRKLSEEIDNLSLGFGEDGLLYIFVSGKAIGNGVEVNGTVVPSNGVAVFVADFSGNTPSPEQFYTWEDRIYANAIYDKLSNIECSNGEVKLTSVYDSTNSKWIQQMMCTGGLFESDNFTCEFEAKFCGLAGSWNNVITYGTGTHWTDGLYSDGVKWPAGGEIDAFEQAGGYSATPNTMNTPTVHWGSGTESGYPNTHLSRNTNTVEFTTEEWHKFKFQLSNGHVKTWIDDVLVGENDFSDCEVSNNYMVDYKPFLKPQAFYIDGSCASSSNEIDTDNVYEFYVRNFNVYQDAQVECTALEVYPQMWEKGTELVFPIGAEIYLDRIYTPSNTSNKACTWETSNPTVATVVQGFVKTLTVGSATITAKCGNATAKYIVNVAEEASIPCSKVIAEVSTINLVKNDEYDLSDYLYVYPSYTTDEVSYSSNSENVSVTDDGVITANNEGEAEITIVCGGKSFVVSVSITDSSKPLLDSTFEKGGKTDTLIGGLTDGETYTAVYILKDTSSTGTRKQVLSFYNNKACGISIDSESKILGREFSDYNIDLGTAYDNCEIRCVFTVGGITKFYVDGELKYTGTKNVIKDYYQTGTDTYVNVSALNDQRYTLSRFVLYKGEYLSALE